MKISVALATYNGQKYIQEQLDSFILQTRLPDELVVCDDGSTDETIEILERFKKNAPFSVRIYSNNINLGYERNFEKVIERCDGEIIFLSDQDDAWFPDKISIVEAVFESHPNVLVVINNLDITDADLKPTGHNVIGQLQASRILGADYKGFIIGCGTAFKSELRALILPIPALKFGHDRWIHGVARSIGSRYVLQQSLQFYRRHGGNASTYIFDRTKRPTWQDMVQPTVGVDLRPIYANQRAVLETISNRLIALGPESYAELKCTLPFLVALSFLKNEQSALTRRILLLDSTGLKRKVLVIHMLINGDYKYFLGWRSFAKDLIR